MHSLSNLFWIAVIALCAWALVDTLTREEA